MLSERNPNGHPEAERIHTTKVAPPDTGAPPQVITAPPPEPQGLFQFNLTHPTLPGTISVTVCTTQSNARGLAYLIAEDFCQQVIGQIKQG